MFFIFGLLAVPNIILSMESQLAVEGQLLQPVQGIILLSSDYKEFVVNEEAIGNSVLLQKHTECNNKRIPLLYASEVVEFLTTILNDPLHQENLLQNKIKELQEENNNASASLGQYIAALKEFDISVCQVVRNMVQGPVQMQMIKKEDSLNRESGVVNIDQSSESSIVNNSSIENRDLFRVDESSCCRQWKCICESLPLNNNNSLTDCVCFSFSVTKQFKNCCFLCFPLFCCREKDGNCYVHTTDPWL